jgi:hypothetical protein
MRRSLVVVEVALAVVLVAGAGLLMRTVYNLSNVDPGFNKSRLMTFSITLSEATYPLMPRLQAIQRLLDTLRAVPGVEAATAMWGLPPNRPGHKTTTSVANATVSSPGPSYIVDYYQYVMADYFETMGIQIVRGRSFQPTDTSSSGLVAIVNEKFAETFWKGRDPIGQRVKPCWNDQPPWFTVVGVAKDVKQGAWIRKREPSSTCQFRRSRGPLPAWGLRHSTTWYWAVPSRPLHCRKRSSGCSVNRPRDTSPPLQGYGCRFC